MDVAQAYLSEHEKSLMIETQSLARDQRLSRPSFLFDPLSIREILRTEQDLRGLEALSVYDKAGVLISSGETTTTADTVDVETLLQTSDNKPKAMLNQPCNKLWWPRLCVMGIGYWQRGASTHP